MVRLHIAAPPEVIEDRVIEQRCTRCVANLCEAGESYIWRPGATLVEFDGGVSYDYELCLEEFPELEEIVAHEGVPCA